MLAWGNIPAEALTYVHTYIHKCMLILLTRISSFQLSLFVECLHATRQPLTIVAVAVYCWQFSKRQHASKSNKQSKVKQNKNKSYGRKRRRWERVTGCKIEIRQVSADKQQRGNHFNYI